MLPPNGYVKLAQQPTEIDIHIVDDVFVKQISISKAGSLIPQHSHRYDHLSMIVSGAATVWAGEELLGDFIACQGLIIKAGIKHTFQTLVDNTTLLCIHNAARADQPEVLEEHQFEGVV